MNGVLPLGHDLARDPFDGSREVIVECAQRAAMYAQMVMDLAQVRDDDGANVMRGRLVVEVKGMIAAFDALARARSAAPHRAAQSHFDRHPAPSSKSEAAA